MRGKSTPGILSPTAMWWLTATYVVASFLIFFACGLRIEPSSLGISSFKCVLAIVVARVLAMGGQEIRSSTLISHLVQYGLVGFSTAMITHGAALTGQPLVDKQLLHLDQTMGYDWRSYANMIAANPVIYRFIRFSYDSIMW